MYHRGGLQRVIRALGPHPRGGDPSELGVEKLDQPAGGLRIAAAKSLHQPSDGFGVERERGCHFGFCQSIGLKK